MRDLYRCLDEYAPLLLQTIAQRWDVSLPEGDRRQQVQHLAAAMTAPEAAARLLASLPDEAQQALTEVLASGGILPAHRLAFGYGSIRRFGPARLERERPWANPTNPLEELYYSGLLYRAYGTLDAYYGELLLVPDLLRESLPQPAKASALQLSRADEPVRVVSDGYALIEDLVALLVHLRQERVVAGIAGVAGSGDEQPPPVLQALVRSGRLVGEADTQRLALIWRMLERLDLVHVQEGTLRPSLRAREWLRLADAQRVQSVYLAWRDDAQWDELRMVSGLKFEETGWKHHPVSTRRRLMRLLAPYAPLGWLLLDDLIEAIKRHQPDLMRPDGDFDSWYIRDAQTDAYLAGFAAWDRVEGATLRHLLTTSLRWMGLVDVGFAVGTATPSHIRLSAVSAALWPQEQGDKPPRPPSHAPRATVGDDFAVILPLANTLYERYQLERLADWESQDARQAHYRITAEAIWRSQNAGIKMEQVLRFLERITDNQVPTVVRMTLQAWGGRFGRVFIRKQIVLQTADAATLAQMRAQPEVAQLLGESLGETACLVAEQDVAELTAQLKALGIWPHIRL
jgi:hypothetical protein